jgi:hypothetical protein
MAEAATAAKTASAPAFIDAIRASGEPTGANSSGLFSSIFFVRVCFP